MGCVFFNGLLSSKNGSGVGLFGLKTDSRVGQVHEIALQISTLVFSYTVTEQALLDLNDKAAVLINLGTIVAMCLGLIWGAITWRLIILAKNQSSLW